MKDHVQQRLQIYAPAEGTLLADYILDLQRTYDGLVESGAKDIKFEVEIGWGDYGVVDYYLVYWRPMTEEEKKRALDERRKVRERNRIRREKQAEKKRLEAEKTLKTIAKNYPELINEIKKDNN